MSFSNVQGLAEFPIGPVVTAGMDLFSLFLAQRQNNEFKVLATAKAENFVKSMFGYGTNCSLPQVYMEPQHYLETIPYSPTKPSYQFCANSVAGMIERCNPAQAQQYLAWLAQQMQQLAQQDARYFGAWMSQYGNLSIQGLQTFIGQAMTKCVVAPPSGGTTTPPPASTGISSTMLLIGGAALVLIMAMN